MTCCLRGKGSNHCHKHKNTSPLPPQSKLFSHNEDKDVVWHSGISLVIAATKYDAFRDADPELKKVGAALNPGALNLGPLKGGACGV